MSAVPSSAASRPRTIRIVVDLPGRGRRPGRAVRTMSAMAQDWLARITGARQAPALGGALLALAACGQAIGQAPGLASAWQAGLAVSVEYVLPLVAFALLA